MNRFILLRQRCARRQSVALPSSRPRPGAALITVIALLLTAVVIATPVQGQEAVSPEMDAALKNLQSGRYNAAKDTLEELAEQGDPTAQYYFGYMHSQGVGVEKDLAKALELYRSAANQNDAMGLAQLGRMYRNGEGVIQDFQEALRFTRLAAEQGNAYAQRDMGSVYANGLGVLRDNEKAHMWYNLAAASGEADAALQRQTLAETMSEADITRAHDRARACVAASFQGC